MVRAKTFLWTFFLLNFKIQLVAVAFVTRTQTLKPRKNLFGFREHSFTIIDWSEQKQCANTKVVGEQHCGGGGGTLVKRKSSGRMMMVMPRQHASSTHAAHKQHASSMPAARQHARARPTNQPTNQTSTLNRACREERTSIAGWWRHQHSRWDVQCFVFCFFSRALLLLPASPQNTIARGCSCEWLRVLFRFSFLVSGGFGEPNCVNARSTHRLVG